MTAAFTTERGCCTPVSSATLHQPVGVVREGAQIHSGHDMMSSRAVTGHVIYPFRDVTRSTYPKSCTVEQTVLLGFRPPLLRVTGSSGTAAGAAARLGGSQAVVPCGAAESRAGRCDHPPALIAVVITFAERMPPSTARDETVTYIVHRTVPSRVVRSCLFLPLASVQCLL